MNREHTGVVGIFWYTLISSILLAAVILSLDDISVNDFRDVVLVTIIVQVLQVALQPVFDRLARWLGIVGILLISLGAYAVLLWGAFAITLDNDNVTLVDALLVAWLYALFVTLAQWLLLAGSTDYFLRTALRTTAKKPKVSSDKPGFVFLQLDGLSWEVLQWQLATGNLPNIQRLLDDEHVARRWKTQIPSTTPASQAGILHGNNQNIPAFRWYERAEGRLVVANKPNDAQAIESRISNGKGLLADGGVSIGNLFTGDAEESILVMSRLKHKQGSLGAIAEHSSYFSSPYGFMRAIVQSLGEILKELFQARRERLKGVWPRVPRHISYVALRAATNVVMRELQTTVILDKLLCGTNVIYADYVDYDEIAHHAGVARPESLASLDGLDRVVGTIVKATTHAPRPYHVVLLSDHGQSQGQTFKQLRQGKSLEDIITELLEASASQRSQKPQLLAFTGSGNLGNLWLSRYTKRPTRKQLDTDYPGFLQEVGAQKGVGLIIVNTAAGPVAIGPRGEINLKSGKTVGQNPLNAYPGITSTDLLKPATMKNAPDIQIFSTYHAETQTVHAFEELVGNHGGIGGWQIDAFLLHPKSLPVSRQRAPKGEIVDASTIYQLFIDWLEAAGHRS